MENEQSPIANQQPEPSSPLNYKLLKLPTILSSNPDHIKSLLSSAKSNPKRGWDTIKLLPFSEYYLS